MTPPLSRWRGSALAAVGPSDKAKPLWKKLLAFEVLVASDQDIRRLVERCYYILTARPTILAAARSLQGEWTPSRDQHPLTFTYSLVRPPLCSSIYLGGAC